MCGSYQNSNIQYKQKQQAGSLVSQMGIKNAHSGDNTKSVFTWFAITICLDLSYLNVDYTNLRSLCICSQSLWLNLVQHTNV